MEVFGDSQNSHEIFGISRYRREANAERDHSNTGKSVASRIPRAGAEWAVGGAVVRRESRLQLDILPLEESPAGRDPCTDGRRAREKFVAGNELSSRK